MKIVITEKQLNLIKEEIERVVPGSKPAVIIASGINRATKNLFGVDKKELKYHVNNITDNYILKLVIEILKNEYKKDFYDIVNRNLKLEEIPNIVRQKSNTTKDVKQVQSQGKKLPNKKVSGPVMRDPINMSSSKTLYQFLKNEEGDPKMKGKPVLVAYQHEGDVPTIGYGHTLNVKLGTKITKEMANKYLSDDVKEAEKCVKNIFAEWKSKGNVIKLTQSMFDALVSLVFNSGCGSLRGTDRPNELIDAIKNKKFHEVPSKIKKFSPKTGFGGIVFRRERESALFCKEGGCGTKPSSGS